jgi:hypothetical protein
MPEEDKVIVEREEQCCAVRLLRTFNASDPWQGAKGIPWPCDVGREGEVRRTAMGPLVCYSMLVDVAGMWLVSSPFMTV